MSKRRLSCAERHRLRQRRTKGKVEKVELEPIRKAVGRVEDVEDAAGRFAKRVRVILKNYPGKRTKIIMRAMVEDFSYLLCAFGLDLVDLKLFKQVGFPKEIIQIIKSARETETKANNLDDFYEKHDTGNVRELVKFYGLGPLIEKILLREDCKTGLDVMKLELSKILASHKYRFGEQTLGKLYLLQRYLRTKYGLYNSKGIFE